MKQENAPENLAATWSAKQSPDKPAGRYIIGLGLIGFMMVVSTVLVARELSTQAADVNVLNLASDEPQLTYEINNAVADLADPDADDESARASLQEALATFSEVYIGLQFGDESLDLSGAASPEVDRLLGLADPLFNQIVTIALSALAQTPTSGDVVVLELTTSAFRSRMEAVVFQYRRETQARVQSLTRLEFLLLSAGLLLLLAEGMLLFRPAARASRRRWHEVRARHAAERERDRADADYSAQFHPLTGLPNRVLFRDRLSEAMKRAERTGQWASVLFVNLDHFNDLNDQFGLETGDELLQEAAERITNTVRAADTVGHLGGDEFAVVVEGSDDTAAAESVAGKVLATLAQPYELQGHELHVTASIGVAIYPIDGEGADTLLRDSALAMYAAKDEGRNSYQFYTPELRRRTSERLALISSLRAAIESEDQLSLWYQPKLDLATGRIAGMEALVRWDHPSQGLTMPDRFIPVAEETGLIIPLDRWVLQEACRQVRDWAEEGLGDLAVSVNVSSRQFHNGDLADTVGEALRRSGVHPSQLELEVTEGTLIEDIEPARVTLDRLRNLGVRISIDDFGTGYSSLSYLKRLPIDVLKIDRSFISALPDDPDDAAISQAIVNLGHTLNMKIVAEGVETDAQYEFLRGLGCDFAQGYLIAAPLPAPRFADFVGASGQLRAG